MQRDKMFTGTTHPTARK